MPPGRPSSARYYLECFCIPLPEDRREIRRTRLARPAILAPPGPRAAAAAADRRNRPQPHSRQPVQVGASENERAFMHISVVDYRAHNRTLGTIADVLPTPPPLPGPRRSTLAHRSAGIPLSSHSRGPETRLAAAYRCDSPASARLPFRKRAYIDVLQEYRASAAAVA